MLQDEKVQDGDKGVVNMDGEEDFQVQKDLKMKWNIGIKTSYKALGFRS